MRYKIGFTIGAETLFRLAAKMLPIEDLSIEELAPRDRAIPKKSVPSATVMAAIIKRPGVKKRIGSNRPVDLASGVNKVIMDALSDGKPRRAAELKPLLAAAGYSPNSVGSRLGALLQHGFVVHVPARRWKSNLSASNLSAPHGSHPVDQ